MRTLLVTVCVVGIVDAMLYAVLIPLLPEITNSLNLGKSAAGFLVAAYALGALSGVIPAGLVTVRLGAKVAVILGMTLLRRDAYLRKAPITEERQDSRDHMTLIRKSACQRRLNATIREMGTPPPMSRPKVPRDENGLQSTIADASPHRLVA